MRISSLQITLLVLISVLFLSTNFVYANSIRADVDQNSVINSIDAILTFRKSLGVDMSGTNWQVSSFTGDVNCDGSPTSVDAALILKKSLGFDMSGTTWCVVEYGELGSSTVLTHTEVDTGDSVIYYPSNMSDANKVPVIFFTPGWGSSNSTDYETLLNFIASHGVAVIYAKDATGDNNAFIQKFEKMLDGNNNILSSLDTTKVGFIGHSSGGGDTFRMLEYFSEQGYGANGRLLMTLDPWFAFDMTSEHMQGLPNNTNLVVLQFGNNGGSTDPRIPLSEYSLLTSINNDKKDYQVYTQESANHNYPKGSRPVDEMQGILKPLHALMNYTFFNGTQEAHDIALEVGSDDPFNDNLQDVEEIDHYPYACNTQVNTSEVMDIDYCNQYLGGKVYPLDTTFDEKAEVVVAQPNYLASYLDTTFENTVTRITDRDNQSDNDKPYPKTQVWNSDMSLIMLGYRIYNANDFSETQTTQNNLIVGTLSEMKWSTKDPNVFYGIDRTNDDFVFTKATIDLDNDIINYEVVPNATFSKNDYTEFLLGKYEGNLDFQDNYVVFSGRKKNTNKVTLIVFHIQDNFGTTYNTIVSQKDFNDIDWYENYDAGSDTGTGQVFDWASISALGNYVLVNYKSKPGDAEQEYSIEQYNRGLDHVRRLAEHGNHGDLGLTVDGKEVYVQFGFGDLNGQNNRGIWMYPLDGSARVQLLPQKYSGGHVSCRNFKRPGWCYINTSYLNQGSGFREAFAIKLDNIGGTVERFAQTHCSDTKASSYVQANVSPDGTEVLFDSDWGDENDELETYHVQVGN